MKNLLIRILGAEPIRLLRPRGKQRPLPLLGRHRQDERGGDGLSHTGDHHGDGDVLGDDDFHDQQGGEHRKMSHIKDLLNKFNISQWKNFMVKT